MMGRTLKIQNLNNLQHDNTHTVNVTDETHLLIKLWQQTETKDKFKILKILSPFYFKEIIEN